MKLTNSFRIDRPPAEVFDAFLDIERVATCLPGSKVLGRADDDTYDGEVRVKVGPLGVAYTGQLRVLDTDRDQLRLTMRAKGREKRGAGNADAHVVAALREDRGGTVVDIDTDLSVRGKVAQFGRGVISDVSADIMQTFAGNVERMLQQGPEPTAEQPVPGQPAARRAEQQQPRGEEPRAEEPLREEPVREEPVREEGLDVWALVVRPLLARHAGSIATVACSGLAAYLGARLGARRSARSVAGPWQPHPWTTP